jgi:hypothetical protein
MREETMSKEKNKATLDKKSIASIVDEVESRLRQPVNSKEPETSETKKGQAHGSKGVFFWGAASGLALAVAAPLLGRQARPVVRGAIKGGILAGRYVQKTASSLKEDVEDITAEAKADLDIERNPPSSPA